MATPGEAQGFDVVPIAFERYRQHGEVAGAEAEAEAIAEALEVFGGRLRPWSPGTRDLTATDARMKKWSRTSDNRDSMLLWIGHGRSAGPDGTLYIPGAPDDTEDQEFTADMFARHLTRQATARRREGTWAIVVVEACGAGRFVEIVYQDLLAKESREGLLLIGSGTGSGRGYLGQFQRVLQAVYGDGSGKRLTTNDTEIPLPRLGAWIEQELGPNGAVFLPPSAGLRPLRVVRPALPPLTTSLEVYSAVRESAEAVPVRQRRPFATGDQPLDLGEIGGGFVGRDDDRAALLGWLRGGPGQILVLTGPPGCGKSALINNVLLHAHPRIGSLVLGPGHPEDADPDAPDLDASLLLTGMSQAELIRRLASVLRIEGQVDESSPSSSRSSLLAALSGRPGQGLRLVVDGLDESDDPQLIAGLLAEIAAVPGSRVVVGTRPSQLSDPDADDLLELLGQGRPAVTVHWLSPDRDAIALYVRQQLTRNARVAAHFAPGLLSQAVSVAAERIATLGAAGRCDFLFARLAVQEVVARPDLLDEGRQNEFTALLRGDHAALFARALHRISADHAAVVPALLALACARGRGMPRSGEVWLTAANGVRDSGPAVTTADLDEIMRLASSYIMIDFEGGETVYRLAHSTFRASAEVGWTTGEADRQIGRALLRLAAGQPELSPYLTRHLSGHLAQAGRAGWAELASAPQVLDRLSVPAVIGDALAGDEPMTRLPGEIQGLLVSGHLSAQATLADRAGLRQLGTARLTGNWKAPEQPGQPPAGQRGAWSLLGADLVREDPHVVLSGHRGAVMALTASRDRSGRGRLLSAGLDGTVRLWDQASAVRSDLAYVRGGILALTGLTLHDGASQLVCTAVRSPSLRRLDPRTGTEAAAAGTGSMGRFVPFRDREGVLRLAGIEDAGLSIRDVLTLELVGEAVVGQQRPVTAIAVLADDIGRPLIANAASDGTLRLWDPRTGHAALDPVRLKKKARALAVAARPGMLDLVLAGHDDGSLTCWNPKTGRTVTSPAGDPPVVDLVAVRPPGGPFLVVAGLEAGSVRGCWLDLDATGEPAGWRPESVLQGHEGRVNCVVVLPPDRARGELISVASGGDDGTVRLWEVEAANGSGNGRATGYPVPPRARESVAWPRKWNLPVRTDGQLAVTARGDGQVAWVDEAGRKGGLRLSTGPAHCATSLTGPGGQDILALAEHDGTISTWGLPAGAPHGPRLRGHTDWVRALAVVKTEAGAEVLVSGGDDGTLRLWRPTGAGALHVIPLDARIVSLSVSGQDVEVGLTTGMITVRLETDQFPAEEERAEHVR
jgi:WD40 repeat protein